MGCRPPDFRIYDDAMKPDPDKPLRESLPRQLFALIPCAGSGSRAGAAQPKQYQRLLGQAMIRHTLAAFRALPSPLAGLWVVVSPDDTGFAGACPDFNRANEVLLRQGGPTRASSVLNSLNAMLADSGGGQSGAVHPLDWILVHDAARCLIEPAQIQALISACRHDSVGGLLAQRLPDTLKCGGSGRVTATLDRSDKWLAQTPQMFRAGALAAALQSADQSVTDESSAMEAMGFSPRLVPGSVQNFKVTYPEDFAVAEAILAHRQRATAGVFA